MMMQGTSAAKLTELSEHNFEQEVLRADMPVAVEFWAPWCGPCRAIAPILNELAGEYAGRLRITKLNTDDNPQLLSELGIMGAPTLLIFHQGREVARLLGARRKAAYQESFDAVLEAAQQ